MWQSLELLRSNISEENSVHTADCWLPGLAATTLECRAARHVIGVLKEESNHTPGVKQVCCHWLLKKHIQLYFRLGRGMCLKKWKVSYDSSLISPPNTSIGSHFLRSSPRCNQSPQLCSKQESRPQLPNTQQQSHHMLIISVLASQIFFPSSFKPSLPLLTFQFPTIIKIIWKTFHKFVLAQLVFTRIVHLLLKNDLVQICNDSPWTGCPSVFLIWIPQQLYQSTLF